MDSQVLRPSLPIQALGLVAALFVTFLAAAAGGLASITMRFQQNCEGFAPALRGKISWAR